MAPPSARSREGLPGVAPRSPGCKVNCASQCGSWSERCKVTFWRTSLRILPLRVESSSLAPSGHSNLWPGNFPRWTPPFPALAPASQPAAPRQAASLGDWADTVRWRTRPLHSLDLLVLRRPMVSSNYTPILQPRKLRPQHSIGLGIYIF